MPNLMKYRDEGLAGITNVLTGITLSPWLGGSERRGEAFLDHLSLSSSPPPHASSSYLHFPVLNEDFFFPLPHAPILPASLPSVAECCPNSILIDGEGKRLIKNGSADCAAAVSFPVKRRVCAYVCVSHLVKYSRCFSVQHWNALVALYSVKGEPRLRKQGCSYLALEKTVW